MTATGRVAVATAVVVAVTATALVAATVAVRVTVAATVLGNISVFLGNITVVDTDVSHR